MTEPTQHFFTSQGLRLSYWRWGDAAKPPLVFVHGGKDNARVWDRIAEGFLEQYSPVALDLRGHGDSEWEHGSYYPLIENIVDLATFLDEVGGRATVIGHSFGGEVALLTAAVYPEQVERIVALEGAGARMDETDGVFTVARLRQWADLARSIAEQPQRVFPSLAKAAARMRQANPTLPEETIDHLTRWASRPADNGYAWKHDPFLNARIPNELRPAEMELLWQQVQCPILHLVGERSHFRSGHFRNRTLDSYFKDSRTVQILEAGHQMHAQQPDAVIATIKIFLAP